MPLFEVAIIQKPTSKEIRDGKTLETLVVAPEYYMAKDAKGAAFKAAQKLTDVDVDLVDVLVRPFV